MMNQVLIFLQDPTIGQGDGSHIWLVFGMMIIFMYFFMIRPQQKRVKAAKEFMNSLEKGQEIVTSGGIHGKVSAVQETTVVISTDAGKLKVEKSALSATYTVPRQ